MDNLENKKEFTVNSKKLGKILRLLLRKEGTLETPLSIEIELEEGKPGEKSDV
jgi:hypothetical protein